MIKALAGLHDIQTEIRFYLKNIQNLVQQILVLRSGTDAGGKYAAARPEFADDRRQFDGFRPGPEYDKNDWLVM